MLGKPAERVIDGDRYLVSRFSPLRSIYIQARVAKLLGPSLAGIISKAKSGGALEQSAVEVVTQLLSAVDPSDMEKLCRELLQVVTLTAKKQGEEIRVLDSPEAIDSAFTGKKATTIYKVVGFVLEENFSDFFGEAGITGLIENFKRKAAEMAKPPAP